MGRKIEERKEAIEELRGESRKFREGGGESQWKRGDKLWEIKRGIIISDNNYRWNRNQNQKEPTS